MGQPGLSNRDPRASSGARRSLSRPWVALGAASAFLAVVAFEFALATRVSALPAAGGSLVSGSVVTAALGRDFMVRYDRRWWGEINEIEIGRTMAKITMPDGSSGPEFPAIPDAAWVRAQHVPGQPSVRMTQRAAGWHFRVYSQTTIRPEVPARTERRLLWPGIAATFPVTLLVAVGFGLGLSAIARRAKASVELRRAAAGLCPRCGYCLRDLPASTACSECGWSVSVKIEKAPRGSPGGKVGL